jgi:STE24 endopeptidase
MGQGRDRELLFVMGHEMGHYVLGHVWQGIAFSMLLMLGSFYVAYRTAGAVIARFGGRFGFTDLADVRSGRQRNGHDDHSFTTAAVFSPRNDW